MNPPVLGYRQDGPHDRVLHLIRSQRNAITAHDDAVLCILPQGEFAELGLALEPLVPDVELWNRPVMAPCDWLLIHDPSPPPVQTLSGIRRTEDLPASWRAQLQGRDFILVNQDTLGVPALWLLRQERKSPAEDSNG